MLVSLNISEMDKFPQNVPNYDGTVYIGNIAPPYSCKIIAQSPNYDKLICQIDGTIADFTSSDIQYVEIEEVDDAYTQLYVNKIIYEQSNLDDRSFNKFKKLKARQRIQEEVGDINDLLADLYKRVLFLERLCYKSLLPLLTESSITYPEKTEHLELLTAYNNVVREEYFKERIDIGDETHQEIIDKLITRSLLITNIINEEYLT